MSIEDALPAEEVVETPLMVTDLAEARNNARLLKEALPSIDIFYAVKANADSRLIQTLDPLVAGFDVASLGELTGLLELGVSAERVLFSNPVKVPFHIEKASTSGVRNFAFDSDAEIAKLSKYAPGADVYLRLTVADRGSQVPLSAKFGVPGQEAVGYSQRASEAGLNVRGVTFHVGSQAEDPSAWTNALAIAGNTLHELRAAGLDVDSLNIGGGFPTQYGHGKPASLASIAQVIQRGVERDIPSGIRVVAEPGRFVAASASTIFTRVIGDETRNGVRWLYLDFGAFQGMLEPLEQPHWRYPVRSVQPSTAELRPMTLTGPTCDAQDTLGDGYQLPADIAVGDMIAIEASGAYTLVYASSFNGFEPPKVVYVDRSQETAPEFISAGPPN